MSKIIGSGAHAIVALILGVGVAALVMYCHRETGLLIFLFTAALSIVTLPWIYERYAWFVLLPILLVWYSQAAVLTSRWGTLFCIAVCLPLYALYTYFGSL
jgi:hypothetical protein